MNILARLKVKRKRKKKLFTKQIVGEAYSRIARFENLSPF